MVMILLYRWQYCPDCDGDVEWFEEGAGIFCESCWEQLSPWFADTGYRWRPSGDAALLSALTV